MVPMYWLWLRHRRQGVLAIVVTLLAIATFGVIASSAAVGEMSFLGNASAPRAEAQGNSQAILPRAVGGANTPSLLDKPLPASAATEAFVIALRFSATSWPSYLPPSWIARCATCANVRPLERFARWKTRALSTT